MRQTVLTLAHTPDCDDAFYYDAIETGKVRLAGHRLQFRRDPINVLNRLARAGAFEVTAISSVAYPAVADRYAVLSVGTSVGRGYGPVLVGRTTLTPGDLAGRRVGVPAVLTTGWFLLRYLYPDAVPVEMPFDRIGQAVAAGELIAGVMIHEELLYYPKLGLERVADLGAAWCDRTGLPLPVGLNVVRRDLGDDVMHRVCGAIHRSLAYSLARPREALKRVSQLGRGPEGGCSEQLVAMFANDDSLAMPADVRVALQVLFRQAADLGIAPNLPEVDVIEPTFAAGTAPTPAR